MIFHYVFQYFWLPNAPKLGLCWTSSWEASWGDFGRLLGGQDGPKTAQDDAKTTQDGSKTGQACAKCAHMAMTVGEEGAFQMTSPSPPPPSVSLCVQSMCFAHSMHTQGVGVLMRPISADE